MLTNSVTEYTDILMISETKLDDIFSHDLYHLKIMNLYLLNSLSKITRQLYTTEKYGC